MELRAWFTDLIKRGQPGSQFSSINDKLVGLQGFVVVEEIDTITGEKSYTEFHNLITDAHRADYASWLKGGSINPPSHIALGTGALAQYAESNYDTDKGLTGSSGVRQQAAQGFQISANKNIRAVWLWLKRIGSSSGTLTVEIQTNATGLPSGTAVTNGTSSAVAINIVGTGYDWVEFAFSPVPALTASTQYHMVLKSVGFTYDAGVAEVRWGTDTSAPSYANGAFASYNGTTWSANSPAADGIFRVIAEPDATYTALTGETIRNALTSQSLQGLYKARLLANFTTAQANDTHGEVGLLNAASSGTLVAIIATKKKKDNTKAWNIYWIITSSA